MAVFIDVSNSRVSGFLTPRYFVPDFVF